MEPQSLKEAEQSGGRPMKDLEANRKRFKAMHAESTGFVMPNVWDAGSAVILAQAGFRAIATTSA